MHWTHYLLQNSRCGRGGQYSAIQGSLTRFRFPTGRQCHVESLCVGWMVSGALPVCGVGGSRDTSCANRGWCSLLALTVGHTDVLERLATIGGGGVPQHTNYWAPRTRKQHQQEHRPQRPTESSDPTQHAKGRTGDCPGPRKGTTTRRNVTQGVPDPPGLTLIWH